VGGEEEEMFKYQEYEINEQMYVEDKDLRLEKTYEMCVSELGLQQKKRDQTIAFYIAIISFVLPTIIKMDIHAKTASFLALYILGIMLVQVVLRYRIYKEVYWITCRTITQLFNFKSEKITKELVHHIFYKTMRKNSSSVLVFDSKKEKVINPWKSYRKILNSAETILYEVLVLMSSLLLWVGIFTLVGLENYGIVVATILTLSNILYWNVHYYKNLIKVYDVLIDGLDSSFNSTFSKAWFLHSFY
jgi:hypothetical protein